MAEIVNALRREQKSLEQAQGQERSLLAQAQQIDQKLSAARKRGEEIAKRLQQTRAKLPGLEAAMAERRGAMARQQQLLAGHLRLLYGLGERGGLRMALSPGADMSLLRASGYFRYLLRARAERFAAYGQALQELEFAARARQEALAGLEQLAAQQREAEQALQAQQRERQTLLAQVSRERKLHERQLAELQQARDQLTQFLSRLGDELEKRRGEALMSPHESFGKIAKRRGKLPRPVQGSFETRLPGVFFPLPTGRPVKAVHRGQVVYADWFRGYGQLLILGHGDRVYTLYGHNQRLLAAQGDWVEAGEVIAKSGESGSLDGRSGLYFEIRRNGRTENPRRWLSKENGA
ncbi:putative peptidase M23B [Magnetofaba australis IT-1]|uniref:Putative peptidase M23B n=1 Tax=Magnetofaba australis IT-1 TaxID=1434232 RepID=A0A1Y2K7Q0_9PROT|nr:putative peptidase M23B [Magnetofaba australis IT-1]